MLHGSGFRVMSNYYYGVVLALSIPCEGIAALLLMFSGGDPSQKSTQPAGNPDSHRLRVRAVRVWSG